MNELIQNMKPFIYKAWEKEGFKEPTAIQAKAIPSILEGKDVIAESPTGTGKTLAYLLPILEKIDPGLPYVQAVILASSHELVMQILAEIQKWSQGSGIVNASFIGGANLKRQLEKLKKRPHIVVGTPGKIYELIGQKKLKMHNVKTIVLDEGDTLLVPEHQGTIQGIIKSTLKDRQLLMFSATIGKNTMDEAKALMKDPEIIMIQKEELPVPKVEHFYFVTEGREKIKILESIARLPNMKGLVFMKDIGEISVTAAKLAYKNLQVAVLHSETKKADREKALKGFRKGEFPLLLSTDVAARGLDIKGLTHVIHFDIPRTTEQYTHRSGRTGRAGAEGMVLSIVTPQEERDLKKIANKLNLTLEKKVFYKGQITDEKERMNSKKNPTLKNNRNRAKRS
ncbi:DEAD/DEAH box helicase [Peribacillus tepidiphilus]|uniref:DEAD/DEAH box helicase n=1 Tax=Peribacillus tepidiphilus TaxID=2652445 RepID=UPI00129237EB|nr:DEAD/DEAH box helicase [Peribacillus tepidiphilus]